MLFRSPGASMSGPALGFKHDRADRLGSGFAGKDDKLKSLVVAFACAHRAGENSLTLMAVQLGPAGEQNGMPEHDHSVARPNVEVPDPELLIDERDERSKLQKTRGRHFEVEGQATCNASTSASQVKAILYSDQPPATEIEISSSSFRSKDQ